MSVAFRSPHAIRVSSAASFVDRRRRSGARSLASIVLASLVAAFSAHADGEALYARHCASCYGEAGDAATPVGRALGIPSFAGASFTRASLLAVLENSKSHAGLDLDALRAEIDALVVALEARSGR